MHVATCQPQTGNWKRFSQGLMNFVHYSRRAIGSYVIPRNGWIRYKYSAFWLRSHAFRACKFTWFTLSHGTPPVESIPTIRLEESIMEVHAGTNKGTAVLCGMGTSTRNHCSPWTLPNRVDRWRVQAETKSWLTLVRIILDSFMWDEIISTVECNFLCHRWPC